MSNPLQACADRITAALDYLGHEPDPLRAITLAESQLRQAQVSLAAGRGEVPQLRANDEIQPITFLRAAQVPRNPWPPLDGAEGIRRRQA